MKTVEEIKATQTTLETEMNTALEAAKALTPATPEFDEAYSRYLASKAAIAKIPEEIAKATLAANSEAIAVAAKQVSEAIVQLVEGLKVADLLGKPVEALRFYTDADKGVHTVFNPITKVTAKGTRTPGQGRTVIVDAEGNRQSLTKFVLAHATDEEKASAEYKYPHAQVATKPKFEAFCEAHALTGYVYETASAGPEPEAS